MANVPAEGADGIIMGNTVRPDPFNCANNRRVGERAKEPSPCSLGGVRLFAIASATKYTCRAAYGRGGVSTIRSCPSAGSIGVSEAYLAWSTSLADILLLPKGFGRFRSASPLWFNMSTQAQWAYPFLLNSNYLNSKE